jgi:hypothetical protein
MSTAPHMPGPGEVGAGSREGAGGHLRQQQQHLGLEDMGEYDLGEHALSSRKEPSSDDWRTADTESLADDDALDAAELSFQ